MLTRFSIALTACLSISRTYALIYPLRHVHRGRVNLFLVVYLMSLFAGTALPDLLGLQYTDYQPAAGICWLLPTDDRTRSPLATLVWDIVDNFIDCATLALPVIPITLSGVVSIAKVHRMKTLPLIKVQPKSTLSLRRMSLAHSLATLDEIRRQTVRRMSALVTSTLNVEQCRDSEALSNNTNPSIKIVRLGDRMRHATVTIIIFTTVYFIFNFPLIILYILWFITALKYSYPGPYFSSTFMLFYSWHLTEALGVALNSLINPWIYFFRIKDFRVWILGEAHKKVSNVGNSHSIGDKLSFYVRNTNNNNAVSVDMKQ